MCVENLSSTTLKSVAAALRGVVQVVYICSLAFERGPPLSFMDGPQPGRKISKTHTQAINQTGSHVRPYCHWCGTLHCPPTPPPLGILPPSWHLSLQWMQLKASRCYMIDLSTRKGTARKVVNKLRNQQQGEHLGVTYAAHFASKQGIHTVNLLIDNMAAIFSSRKVRASPKAQHRRELSGT